MFLNSTMPFRTKSKPVTTTGRAEVSSGVRIALDPDKGMIRATERGDLVVDLEWSDPAPAWSELVWVLPPEWRQCRRIFLRYCAATNAESACSIRPALRMGYDEVFFDHFGPPENMLSKQPTEYLVEFTMPPRRADRATYMDLHLFFGRESGQVVINEVSLTGLR